MLDELVRTGLGTLAAMAALLSLAGGWDLALVCGRIARLRQLAGNWVWRGALGGAASGLLLVAAVLPIYYVEQLPGGWPAALASCCAALLLACVPGLLVLRAVWFTPGQRPENLSAAQRWNLLQRTLLYLGTAGRKRHRLDVTEADVGPLRAIEYWPEFDPEQQAAPLVCTACGARSFGMLRRCVSCGAPLTTAWPPPAD